MAKSVFKFPNRDNYKAVYLEKDVFEKLDKTATRLKMTKSKLLRHCFEKYIADEDLASQQNELLKLFTETVSNLIKHNEKNFDELKKLINEKK